MNRSDCNPKIISEESIDSAALTAPLHRNSICSVNIIFSCNRILIFKWFVSCSLVGSLVGSDGRHFPAAALLRVALVGIVGYALMAFHCSGSTQIPTYN